MCDTAQTPGCGSGSVLRMSYIFKSRPDGNLLMQSSDGDRILSILGRRQAARGIIESGGLSAAIQALESSITRDEPGPPRVAEWPVWPERVRPLLNMMKRARGEVTEVVWSR